MTSTYVSAHTQKITETETTTHTSMAMYTTAAADATTITAMVTRTVTTQMKNGSSVCLEPPSLGHRDCYWPEAPTLWWSPNAPLKEDNVAAVEEECL